MGSISILLFLIKNTLWSTACSNHDSIKQLRPKNCSALRCTQPNSIEFFKQSLEFYTHTLLIGRDDAVFCSLLKSRVKLLSLKTYLWPSVIITIWEAITKQKLKGNHFNINIKKKFSFKAGNVGAVLLQMSMGGGSRVPSGEPLVRLPAYSLKKKNTFGHILFYYTILKAKTVLKPIGWK